MKTRTFKTRTFISLAACFAMLFCSTIFVSQSASASNTSNQAPIINQSSDQTVYEGATLQFQINATDPDGDSLTYTAKQIPEGSALLPDGIFAWNPDYNQSGNYSATFTVSDGTHSVDTSVNIKVLSGDPSKPAVGGDGTLHGKALNIPPNVWTEDISKAPVLKHNAYHFSSQQYINSPKYQGRTQLHPSFGTYWAGIPNGIPYNIVDNSVKKVPVKITQYIGESDLDPGSKDIVSVPIPKHPFVEGMLDPTSTNPGGDRHLLIYNRDTSMLYELYNVEQDPKTGQWTAFDAVIFNPKDGYQRPEGLTSSDAAGLPVLPGLVRYDEIQAGHIDHAIRFTMNETAAYFIPPAKHLAAIRSKTNPQDQSEAPLLPMGAKLRLKSNFDISSYPKTDQIILKALKKYGMILADNGSNYFIGGAPDYRWDDSVLGKLKQVPASAFEVVDTGNWEPAYTVDNPHKSVKVNQRTEFVVKLNKKDFNLGLPHSQWHNTDLNMKVTIKDDLGNTVPATVSLSSSKPVATFTYTPTSVGKRTFTFSNDTGLINPTPIILNVTS